MLLRVVDARELLDGTVSLPDAPGVYAWYRRLSLDDTSAESFLNSVEELVSIDSWPVKVEGTGKLGPYRADIRLQPQARSLGESKKSIAQNLAQHPTYRARMTKLVLMASVLQPPLYVGEATNLSSRIRQHLTGQSQFIKSMNETFDRSQLVVSYLETLGLPDDTRWLLEAIVGSATLPRYAGRIG